MLSSVRTVGRFGAGLGAGVLLSSLFAWNCGGGGAGSGAESLSAEEARLKQMVIAEIGRRKITVGDLDFKIKIQFAQMAELTGVQAVKQKREVLKAMVDQYCWVTLAEQKGYDKDQKFRDVAELSRKFILANHAADREVYSQAKATDPEIQTYYDENPDQYRVVARCQASMLLVGTRAEAERLRARIAAGENFEELARQFTRHDPSRASGGLIGTVTQRSTISGFAEGGALNQAIMALSIGALSAPIETEKGWAIVRINDRTEDMVQPLEQVRDQIKQKVELKRTNELFSTTLARVREETGAKVDEAAWDEYTYSFLTEDEAFMLAQGELKPDEKIRSLEALIRRHPKGARAPQALFLAAFTWAEELKDYPKAKQTFDRFLKEYPEGELAASARWMLQNMDRGLENLPEVPEIKRRARIK